MIAAGATMRAPCSARRSRAPMRQRRRRISRRRARCWRHCPARLARTGTQAGRRPSMLSRHVALVSETKQLSLSALAAAAAALQKQVTRDFAPIWRVEANVSAFGRLEDVPLDYWPIVVAETLPRPEAAGYHQDELG